jgi:hypothetical protein
MCVQAQNVFHPHGAVFVSLTDRLGKRQRHGQRDARNGRVR